MADEPRHMEVRRIDWSSALPFVRLWRTVSVALEWQHLGLAFCAVVALYLGGRVLDGVWLAAGGGVVANAEGDTEIETFSHSGARAHQAWLAAQRQARQSAEFAAAQRYSDVRDEAELRRRVDAGDADDLVRGSTFREDVRDALQRIEQRETAGLRNANSDANLTGSERAARRLSVRQAADHLRFVLALRPPPTGAETATGALDRLIALGGHEGADDNADRTAIAKAVARAGTLREIQRVQPRGVFMASLDHQMDCFAAAVQGVISGRLTYGAGADSPAPSMLGSMASALGVLGWLVLERPWFSVIYGLWHVSVMALFGVAICRSAAIRVARQRGSPVSGVLAFAREKWVSAVFAVLMPLAIILGLAVVLWLAGLLGAIPVLGPLLAGLLFVLALVLGFAAALAFVAFLLGHHLFWPTIAIEGSDAFDAFNRAGSYVTQRLWHLVFYGLALLVYGALAFLLLRLILVLSLKFAHAFVGAGMSWFGAWSSAATSSISRLDAMWWMPAWGELPLLPTVAGPPMWGEFGIAPLSGAEWLASFLMAAWVFALVAVLGAFVLSFYFCGGVQVYLLLRRDFDGIDYDEIYYELEESDEPLDPQPAPQPPNRGTALPVVGGGSPPSA